MNLQRNNLLQQLRVPTGQEAPSDRKISKRHKSSPCDGSLQQDTERMKQIMMYEYGDGQTTDPQSMDSPNGLPKWTTSKMDYS